jgi:hypothetical protein
MPRPPSLISERLTQRRKRPFRAFGRKCKPPRRFPCYFNLADRHVDMPGLVAISGSDVRAVDQDDDLGVRIDFGLRFRQRDVASLQVSCHTMRSIAHGRMVHRVARQQHRQQPGGLPIGMLGA